MEPDFSLKIYLQLLNALSNQGFSFSHFSDFIVNPGFKTIIFRHDVDREPQNALIFAEIQHDLGIKGSYYFMAVPESWQEEVIKKIYELGHEVGYHYEDVSLAADRLKAAGGRQKDINKKYSTYARATVDREVGSREYEEFEKVLVDKAIESFSRNL